VLNIPVLIKRFESFVLLLALETYDLPQQSLFYATHIKRIATKYV